MAHLNDGTLRRMVDDPDARVGANAAHLEACPECQSRFKAFSDDARSIATLLAVPEPHVDTARAYERVIQAPKSAPPLGIRLPILQSGPRRLTLALVAAVIAAALSLVAFAASGALFYTPKTVQAVPVTAVDIQTLARLTEYGTFTWNQQPNLSAATSAVDASNAANVAEPTVGYVPPGISSTVTYGAMTRAEATFQFSAAKASAAAASHGTTAPPMPAGLDGATLTISAGPAVGMVYGEVKQPSSANDISQVNLPQLVILKSTAPTIKSDVSLDVLESYLVQQPGLSNDLKSAIEAITDTNPVLLVPVPMNYVTSTPYDVKATDAVAGHGVALGDNTGVGAGVVWIGKDGYVYVVAGSIKVNDAEQIADNLK